MHYSYVNLLIKILHVIVLLNWYFIFNSMIQMNWRKHKIAANMPTVTYNDELKKSVVIYLPSKEEWHFKKPQCWTPYTSIFPKLLLLLLLLWTQDFCKNLSGVFLCGVPPTVQRQAGQLVTLNSVPVNVRATAIRMCRPGDELLTCPGWTRVSPNVSWD